jgi:glycosyltransferase involved in cell wall biosynthesis
MAAPAPDFSIVTPSLDMLGYLQRCRRSIADQEGVSLEHIVRDGESRDGTVDWLTREAAATNLLDSRQRLIVRSEKDEGMYDAVNKGFRAAHGRILAYLNCDEQYLPGTLQAVREVFERHPEVDFVFGDSLLVRSDGTLVACRKAYPLRWHYVLSSHLYALSCTMFFRDRVILDGQLFDSSLRDVADAAFVVKLLRSGYRGHHLCRYLAAFTLTGSNRSAEANAHLELEQLRSQAPSWVRRARMPLNLLRWTEKCLAGAYHQPGPLIYSIYDDDESRERQTVAAQRPGVRWLEP